MTPTTDSAGALEIAAALAFHLPGARLELASPGGRRCSIGPITDPRCTLHPAEFRELVLAAGDHQTLGNLLGFAVGDQPSVTLVPASVEVSHVGAGLYRVSSPEVTSYAFTTPLSAELVDDLLSNLHEEAASRCCSHASGAPYDGAVSMCVSLVRDEALGVTLVVVSAADTSEPVRCEAAARAAVAACLVAEMEGLSSSSCLNETPT